MRRASCADRWCEGRVLSLLEGGYDLEGLTASVAEHVNALA
jgi:acetoin utilization deacetylase AcuC-like enzyme